MNRILFSNELLDIELLTPLEIHKDLDLELGDKILEDSDLEKSVEKVLSLYNKTHYALAIVSIRRDNRVVSYIYTSRKPSKTIYRFVEIPARIFSIGMICNINEDIGRDSETREREIEIKSDYIKWIELSDKEYYIFDGDFRIRDASCSVLLFKTDRGTRIFILEREESLVKTKIKTEKKTKIKRRRRREK